MLTIDQKLQIIQWHAVFCLDGNTKGGRNWKSALANRLGCKPSAITKWTKSGYSFSRKSTASEALAALQDEAFFDALLGQEEADAQKRPQLPTFTNANHYAHILRSVGLKLRAEGDAAAKKHDATLLRQRKRWRNFTKEYVYVAARPPDGDTGGVPLHPDEEREVRKIYDTLKEPAARQDGILPTVVSAAPHSGISHLLYRLFPLQPDVREYYPGGFHHLHLEALERMKDAGRVVKDKLIGEDVELHGADEKIKGWNRLIAEKLCMTGGLLIVHGASSAVEAGSKSLSFLVEIARNINKASQENFYTKRRCSRLLLIGWDLAGLGRLNNGNTKTVEFSPALNSGGEAFEYFKNCAEYYWQLRSDLSGQLPFELQRPANNSIKRVEHHYRIVDEEGFKPMPSSVRFRAFSVTDVHAPSPLDPTQGIWDRLNDELRSRVPEIYLALGDLQNYVRSLRPAKKENELEAIRLSSTALFQFSAEMHGRLIKNHAGLIGTTYEELDLTIFGSQGNFLRLNEGRKSLISPLLVRALIQDDWIEFGPEHRAAVHAAIAEELYTLTAENDLETMARVLPYSARRGNQQIFFALEAIRHFMRAARTASSEDKEKLTQKALETYDRFLEPGMFAASDEKAVSGKWRLSRAFGMDSLKFEALCLLSEDGYGNSPPIGLDKVRTARYFRELGITLTHNMRPAEALEAFHRAVPNTVPNSAEQAYVFSHQITAELDNGQIDKAKVSLARCREIEFGLPAESDSRNRIKERNKAREAAIALAEEGPPAARSMLPDLAEGGLTDYSGQRALLFIDAHLPPFPETEDADLTTLNQTLVATEQARTEAWRRGFKHERVRLSIRRARIYRLLGLPKAAVPVLERVGEELHRDGGSETAYREFQLASAETLLAIGQPGYAFAAYAWPAFQALDRLNVPARREFARRLCLHLLDKFNECEKLSEEDQNPFRQYIAETDRYVIHPSFSFRLLPSDDELSNFFEQFMTAAGRERYKQALIE